MNNDNILYKHSVYLDVAKNISKLSKDPNTKVGAVIVAEDGTLVSGGYNGTLQKVDESNIPSGREPSELTLYTHQYNIKTHEYNNLSEKITLCINKYPYICHAEYNAITFSDRNKLKNSTLYCTHIPCSLCALKIAQNEIKLVICPEQNNDTNSIVGKDFDITLSIFAMKNITLVIGDIQYQPTIENNKLPF